MFLRHTIHRLVSHRTKADASRYKKEPGLAGRKVFEVEYYRESTRHDSHAISSSAVCGLCLYAGHVPHAAKKTVTNRAKSIITRLERRSRLALRLRRMLGIRARLKRLIAHTGKHCAIVCQSLGFMCWVAHGPGTAMITHKRAVRLRTAREWVAGFGVQPRDCKALSCSTGVPAATPAEHMLGMLAG